jgi:hypothetical protein
VLSIIVEPAKVLFLNNAINHGVFTPLGIEQATEAASRSCSSSRPTPAPASDSCSPSRSSASGGAASAPGAIIIQFFGGIHEIYFPYALAKPMTILALIAGGATGTTNMLLGGGLAFPAAPGSIIAVGAAAIGPGVGNLLVVYLSVASPPPSRSSSPVSSCGLRARPRRRGGGPPLRGGDRADRGEQGQELGGARGPARRRRRERRLGATSRRCGRPRRRRRRDGTLRRGA